MNSMKDGFRNQRQNENSCSLGVITFEQREWIDHTVRIVELSEQGVWIEADEPIEPGFVWFNDRVAGHKGGVLLWCKKRDERYRAIIQFVPLTRDEERSVQQRTIESSRHRPRRSPDEIISVLIRSMGKIAPSSNG